MSLLLKKLTPVLIVERIEPVLAFWAKLDVRPTVEVPDAAAPGRLGFVILNGDGIEVMYQTRASVRADMLEKATAKAAFVDSVQQSTLFIEVRQLAEVEQRLVGESLFMPRRKTFYGMAEAGYTEPAGNLIVFAEPLEA